MRAVALWPGAALVALVVVTGCSKAPSLSELEASLASTAWAERRIGEFRFSSDDRRLEMLEELGLVAPRRGPEGITGLSLTASGMKVFSGVSRRAPGPFYLHMRGRIRRHVSRIVAVKYENANTVRVKFRWDVDPCPALALQLGGFSNLPLSGVSEARLRSSSKGWVAQVPNPL